MAEIAGDAALLVDPLSQRSIAAALRQILLDAPLRQRLIGAGRARCRLFTKENTIASLASALRSLSTLAYNTVGGLSLNHGSPGYTGTGSNLRPGPPPVRSEKTA
jgi:hypothetical protein